MNRWAWRTLLSLLVLVGCSRHAPQEEVIAPSDGAVASSVERAGSNEDRASDAPIDLEKFEFGAPEAVPSQAPPPDPTLEWAGQGEPRDGYNDDSDLFEHRGGGMAVGRNDDGTGGAGGFGVTRYGNGPNISGSGGVGTGQGTGRSLGSGGDGAGYGAREHRPSLGPAPAEAERGAIATGPLPSLAGGKSHRGSRQADAVPPQPVETWKPSRLVANTSRLMVGDREELPLKGLQADVRIDGFRARVLLDLYFYNDRPQQLEGNFQLRLPDEASPNFFAFGRTVYQAVSLQPDGSVFFTTDQVRKGETAPAEILALRSDSWQDPKVARVVPKEKAAHAYRETVRRRVDPALVEWAGAGVFQCRVFPLAPNTLHRVVIGYDVDLVRAGGNLELRLDLPEQLPACVVDLAVTAQSERQVTIDAPAEKVADSEHIHCHLVNPKQRPIMVKLHEPGPVMLVGSDRQSGPYFAARLRPEVPAAGPFAGSTHAVFLVDASLSAGPQFPIWQKLLHAVLEANRDRIQQFAVLFFNVETFWWQERFVPNTPENVQSLIKYANSLTLEGATDLGLALKEAAAPEWFGKSETPPTADMFLLSDGAATWGEDEWSAMAGALRLPGVGPLFAYSTGMSGSEGRLLARLAEASGGAVFSLVGEAEIAKAAIAHRSDPWRLTRVEVPGASDLLVVGRPQFVFPDQQLTVAGRGSLDPRNAQVVLTLRQGKTTKQVRTKIGQVLYSELAPRVYGQAAVGQLEDLGDPAEPMATAYARHFRVTGRTCSLLMLESEADYARFNIKPEEDLFVVKDRPASSVINQMIDEIEAAGGDAKAAFLAWFRKLQRAPGVRFDLPTAVGIALEGMPKHSFVVSTPPLRCKTRARHDLPSDVCQHLMAGKPEYGVVAAEARRRYQELGAADALRAISSLVEDQPGDTALARDVAFSAMEWGLSAHAYPLLRRVAATRVYEPQTFHALARCLEETGRGDLAMVYYELAYCGQWDARFGDLHRILGLDYLRFLRRAAEGHLESTLGNYARSRLATLAPPENLEKADLLVVITWNTDGTDVDLHVTEPGGEECYFRYPQTSQGGRITQDVTTGYGPEMYVLPQAAPGLYRVRVHYFGSDANRVSARSKVYATIYQGWGTKNEKVMHKAVTLAGRSDLHEVAQVFVGSQPEVKKRPAEDIFGATQPKGTMVGMAATALAACSAAVVGAWKLSCR